MNSVIAGMRFTPLVPQAVLIALAVAALLVLIVAVWRRAQGTVLRALAFAVLIFWLAGPRLVRETRESLPDIALLAIDQTASMHVGDRARLTDAASATLAREAAKVPGLELRTITVPDAPEDGGTRLFSAIDRALGDIPAAQRAGVIAITDGQAHDAPAAGAPDHIGAPLHVLIPAHGEETDRRIRIVSAPGFGIVGHSVTVRLAIDDLGAKPPADGVPPMARLTMRRDGEPPETQPIPVGQPVSIDLPVTRAGPSVVEFTAAPLPGEVSTLNNRAVITINGVRDRLRVLLISGEPHPGERTWRRLLKADPAVDLVHFTILRPPERDDMTPLNELALIAFPVRELFQVKLHDFDLVILDRFQNRGLLPQPYLRNIADYVTDGGALLLSAGPEFSGPGSLAASPLGAVLPARPASVGAVVEEPFRPRVSDLGQRHPVTAGLAPAAPGAPGAAPHWGVWYRRIAPADATGEVVMTSADADPLLILDRVGRGRTALLLSDQIWLWSRGHDGGGPQAELLRRLAHWLMQEPELEENALVATASRGQLHIERRSIDPAAAPDLTVTDPDGKTTTAKLAPAATPGIATADIAASAEGVWRISDGAKTAFVAVGAANPRELADLRATASVIGPAARASGGDTRFIAPTHAAADAPPHMPELLMVEPDRRAEGSDWIGLLRRHAAVTTGVDSRPLLPATAALPLMIALILLAWRRESR